MAEIVDFDSKRGKYLLKKKEEKVNVLRKAFRRAREESDPNISRGKRKNRKTRKK